MAVRKTWAYLNQTGPETITAREHKAERDAKGGGSLHGIFWSTHKSGQRFRMEHIVRDGTTFFRYYSAADEAIGGPGESLSHRLLKEAISQIKRTKLVLPNRSTEIEIHFGDKERLIEIGTDRYYADAYLQFTSKSDLAARWSGEVYIEVWHKHRVPDKKREELFAMKLPVVEVPMQDAFLYRYEENTTRQREAEHVAKLVKMLESNFLKGTVISDRRSVEFLETRVSELEQALTESRAELHSTRLDAEQRQQESEQVVSRLHEQLQQQTANSDTLLAQLNALKNAAGRLQEDLRAANRNLDGTRQQLSDANRELVDRRLELKDTRQALSEVTEGASTARLQAAGLVDEVKSAGVAANKYRSRAHIAYGVVAVLLAVCVGGGYVGCRLLTTEAAPPEASTPPARSAATASTPLASMKTASLGRLPKRNTHRARRKQVIARPSEEQTDDDSSPERQSTDENAN
jgi:hypothetical protein